MLKKFNKDHFVFYGIDGVLKEIKEAYEYIKEENKQLREIIKELEADKLNDERVKELTEKITWMEQYGFFLTQKDFEKVKQAKLTFEKDNSNLKYSIEWDYSICHLGEIAVCFAIYTDEYGMRHKDEICVIGH